MKTFLELSFIGFQTRAVAFGLEAYCSFLAYLISLASAI